MLKTVQIHQKIVSVKEKMILLDENLTKLTTECASLKTSFEHFNDLIPFHNEEDINEFIVQREEFIQQSLNILKTYTKHILLEASIINDDMMYIQNKSTLLNQFEYNNLQQNFNHLFDRLNDFEVIQKDIGGDSVDKINELLTNESIKYLT